MFRYLLFLLLFLSSCNKTIGDDTVSTNPVDSTDITYEKKTFFFFIGTYTDGGSKGIYKSSFQTDSGKISTPELVATITNPSFQCISNDNSLLWSVSESWNGTGSVFGYSVDNETGKLTQVSTFSSKGDAPCYVNYHKKSGNVVTSNYNSGNVTNIPVNSSGKSDGNSFSHQHTGRGPNSFRQSGPHAHCAIIDPGGEYIYSCDLGTDEIYIYKINNDSLTLFKKISFEAGSGPRHIAFHPKLKSMEVISEMKGTITTFLPDNDGCFSIYHHTVSTLPDGFTGYNQSADIHFTPNGQYLYASNRGPNSIAIFKFNESTLQPEILGWQSQDIKTPRSFNIDPTGKYLIVANQDANNIVVFKIEYQTGNLMTTGNKVSISKPTCITFLNSN